MTITFDPGDIVRLAALLAAACAIGLGAGWGLRRQLRPNAPFHWQTAAWMWLGVWAFGMLMSLVADLTTAAGAPFWLKPVMFGLLAVMAIGIAQAERRFHRHMASIPSTPIHQLARDSEASAAPPSPQAGPAAGPPSTNEQRTGS